MPDNVDSFLHSEFITTLTTLPEISEFFGKLKSYLAVTPEDLEWVKQAWPLIEPNLDDMVSDFYETLIKHEHTRRIITGGDAQIQRLRGTLRNWIISLFHGPHDAEFAWSRWQVGRRHVEIGLHQAYAIAALGRLRLAMNRVLSQPHVAAAMQQPLGAINKLLDLDLAIIDLAYQQNAAEILRQTAAEKVKQSERLAAIGQMVTGLAHESRNALQRSHACLEALLLDIQDRPDAIKQANRIQSALDRLHLLYEEVRNYAAPIKLDRELVDMENLLTIVWQNLEPRWSENQTHIEFVCQAPEPCTLFVDRHRIDQVFTNLLQNAIDASGPQGQIRCTLRWDPPSASCEITVEDNGPGIPAEVLSRIFEPFFTTKTKGTGLGLAITRRIIEAHGGELTVGHSNLGGALFTLRMQGPHREPARPARPHVSH